MSHAGENGNQIEQIGLRVTSSALYSADLVPSDHCLKTSKHATGSNEYLIAEDKVYFESIEIFLEKRYRKFSYYGKEMSIDQRL